VRFALPTFLPTVKPEHIGTKAKLSGDKVTLRARVKPWQKSVKANKADFPAWFRSSRDYFSTSLPKAPWVALSVAGRVA